MNVEPQTPGQTEPAGTAAAAPPTEAAPQVAAPAAPPSAPPQPEAEQGTPAGAEQPAAPAQSRDEKGRFLTNAERAKAGEAGGWMNVLNPQDREELKNEPWRYAELKAKVAAMEAAQNAYRQPEPPKPAGPDAAQVYAGRMARLHTQSEKMTVEEFYREQAEIQRDYQAQIASEIAAKQAAATYEKMTEQQEVRWIAQQPESKNPDFMDKVVGLWSRANGSLTRAQAFEQTKAWFAQFKANGVAEPPRVPTPPPQLGEMRSAAQPASQPSEDIYTRFARTAGGKAINARNAGR